MKILLISVIIFLSISLYSQNSIEYISPKPTGPWDVGRKLVEWVDSSRIDITDSSQYRTIPVFIWYPAAVNDTVIPQYPLDDDWRNEQGKYLDKKIGVGASQFLQNIKVWSLPNAPAVSIKVKFPVLIFGPGHTWLPTDYSILLEQIVSYGYIVVGYIPTGFPGVTRLANGKFINNSLTVNQQDISFEDAMFVLKNLHRLENGWLKEIININQVGAFGHSLGGVAATVLAGNSFAVKAFVNLDGDLMGTALKIKVTKPGLLLSNDERVGMSAATDKKEREGRERSEYRRHSDWVRATDDARVSLRIRVDGIRHLNFNDLGIVPMDIIPPAERKDKLGIVDGARSLKIISDITRQFFDAYLKNNSFFTLVNLEEKFPELQALLWKGMPYY